ncbi:ATP-binding protein [Cupriavidus yeoncheonensis]|uniref:ATP-binding protein n=1 Tax=Cupriavidus yeoncheonensis TaxID=1462994 RepID=UPI001E41F0C5|nr:ATP-binding protein [Cupriavidus yeoncheonensis]
MHAQPRRDDRCEHRRLPGATSLQAEHGARQERKAPDIHEACVPAEHQGAGAIRLRLRQHSPDEQIQELASLALIERAENVLLLGFSGVGMTHIASAPAYRVTRGGHQEVLHYGHRPVMRLATARQRNRLPEFLSRAISGPRLLVIDGSPPFWREEADSFRIGE